VQANLARREDRSVSRDEVHFRAKAIAPGGRPVSILVVNISAMGLMARTDALLETGDCLRVMLPKVGTVVAEVRWALGGRIGCQLDQAIPLSDYYAVLAAMVGK
jgi:hypothetical protein